MTDRTTTKETIGDLAEFLRYSGRAQVVQLEPPRAMGFSVALEALLENQKELNARLEELQAELEAIAAIMSPPTLPFEDAADSGIPNSGDGLFD